jgi:hypothetical protein
MEDPMTTDHPDPSTPPADPQSQHPSPRPSPIRAALLWRFSDTEDAAAVRRVGAILDDLLEASEQHGPKTDDNQFRPAVLAVVHDLLADAANLAAIAEQRAWDGDLSSEEFALAMRADAWADQVKALAASFLHELGEEAPGEGPVR